jgi:hypothetical protein
MKKIISIVAIFALLVSFADLAMATSKKKYRHRHYQRGGVIQDTGRLGSDAVVGTGRVVEGATKDTGRVIRDIF